MTDATKTDVTQADAPNADATKAPALIEGGLYVVRDGRLRRIVHADGLPRVEVSHQAKDALHDLQRKCRRLLRGFRPDIAILASALIEYAVELPEPQALLIIDRYVRKLGLMAVEPPPGAHVINV